MNRIFAAVVLLVLAAPAARAAGDAAACKRIEGLLLRTEYAKAEAQAERAVETHPKSAAVRCVAARVHLARGRYKKALAELDQAIELDFKRLEPRARKAELLDGLGRRDEAVRAANAVIEYYNEHTDAVTSPRERVAVGLALKLVNAPQDALRILTRAQREAKDDPRPTLELGWLFLLKRQVTDASKEFNNVLRAHKNHPEARLGLAECALSVGKLEDAEGHARAVLEVAPNVAGAYDLLAAMAAIDDDFEAAHRYLDKSLVVNPNGISARAIRAGCHLVRGKQEAFEREEARVRKINPRCADFYTYVGRACARKRRMTLAERMFRTAIKLDPEAHGAMAELGRHLFRRAKYQAAKEQLERSHQLDGFNVRTYNTLNLLDEMENYAVFEGPAVTVRLKGDEDGVLAEYAKAYAARALEELSETYGYRPTEPITVEVLPTQRYFAARCIGLPHIGAIGVCFGRVVALTSPRVQRGRTNWRETLRHEMTHAVTLLGSNYRIPHWLTEAMAVHEQQSERPYAWDVLLKTSVRFDRLIPFGELTRGFTRPKNARQRMLAYCQSELVLDFLLHKHGPKCLPALVRAFGEGKELPDAIRAVAGTSLEDFEKGCLAYIRAEVATIPVLPRISPEDESAILDAAAKRPDDPVAQCTQALLLAAKRKFDAAAKAATKAATLDPKRAEALYILARVRQHQDKMDEAMKVARQAVAADDRYAPAHFLLAQVLEKKGEADAAIEHYRRAIRGHKRFPQPYRELARMYRERKEEEKAIAVLEELIANTSNPLAECLDLAGTYRDRKRWKDAARVADLAIGIGPFHPDPHVIAGHALWELGRTDRAVGEMEIAILCADPVLKRMESLHDRLQRAGRKERAAKLGKKLDEARRDMAKNGLRLARGYLKQGDAGKAKRAALAAFDLDPNNEEVRALLRRLQ
jgi:tetratricopeptide (TPR) repeat protein